LECWKQSNFNGGKGYEKINCYILGNLLCRNLGLWQHGIPSIARVVGKNSELIGDAMNIRDILKNLSEQEIMVITACIHHCAVLPKEERKRFVKDYGEATDRNLTKLIGKLLGHN